MFTIVSFFILHHILFKSLYSVTNSGSIFEAKFFCCYAHFIFELGQYRCHILLRSHFFFHSYCSNNIVYRLYNSFWRNTVFFIIRHLYFTATVCFVNSSLH